MIQLVRNNSPFTAILLALFLLLVQIKGLIHATLPVASEHQLVFGAILNLLKMIFGNLAILYSLVNLLFLYVQALLLYQIASQYRLYINNTYLVVFSFVALTGLHPSFASFNPNTLVNLLVLLSFSELMKLKLTKHVNKHLFNIGFLLMLAMMIQFSIVLIIPVMFISLFLLRPFNIKEFVILKLGIFMPLYFLFVFLFCTDSLSRLKAWPYLVISLPKFTHAPIYIIGLGIGLIIWFGMALYTMQTQLPKASIYTRRTWISISFLLIGAVLSSIFSEIQNQSVWLISLPALSFVLSQAFYNQRSEKFNKISFYFALALVLFCQIFFPIKDLM